MAKAEHSEYQGSSQADNLADQITLAGTKKPAKLPQAKPRRSRPEASAEKQLDRGYDHDARQYLPVADKLLKKYDLTVPEWARARLAKTFWEMRELPADTRRKGEESDAKNRVYLNCEGFVDGKPRWERVEVKPGDPVILHSIEHIKGRAVRKAVVQPPEPEDAVEKEQKYTPVPGLKSAQKHISKLLGYAENLPAHKGRVAARCANLRAALLNAGSYGAFSLAIESSGDGTDYGKLLDALEAGRVCAADLERLKDKIDRILARGESWRLGQPLTLTKRIVRKGCIVWKNAGRGPEYYQKAQYGKERLTGPLADFLRNYIACCNGTHEWVRTPPIPPSKYRPPPPPRIGDELNRSDTLLHQDMVAFWLPDKK